MAAPEDTTRTDAIFAKAREITEPAQPGAYLDQACAEDRALRTEVESLLAADRGAADFMKLETLGLSVAMPGAKPGEHIGRWCTMRASTHWFRSAWYGTMLAAAAGSLAGCASKSFVMESIPARMKAHPDAYRHVGIVSLALTSRAITDSSLTTNDLTLLSRHLGTNLLNALTRTFADKGYHVTHTCSPLCTAEDWEELDRETGGLATEARTNLATLGEEIYANRPNQKFNPIDYKIPPSVAALGKKLGQEDVDVLVMLDSKVYVETPEAKHERDKWNWPGGAILTTLVVGIALFSGGGGEVPDLPIKHSPAWVAHTILIADAHSLEVLYWNSRTFLHENARNTEAMRGKFRELLADFAELPKHQ